MKDVLWILALGNVAYLLYAINKARRASRTYAEEVRVLDVSDETLLAAPVPKQVTLKPVEEAAAPNPWEEKISSTGSGKGRRQFDHNQMLLGDCDKDIFN